MGVGYFHVKCDSQNTGSCLYDLVIIELECQRVKSKHLSMLQESGDPMANIDSEHSMVVH